MLISTVCKTHGLSRIRGPILGLSVSLQLRPCYCTAFTTLQSTRRVDSSGRSTRASGGNYASIVGSIFDFRQRARRGEISLVRLSDPVPRVEPSNPIVSSDFHCVASGRAPISLTMACVLNWSPCRGGTRRYTVYKYH